MAVLHFKSVATLDGYVVWILVACLNAIRKSRNEGLPFEPLSQSRRLTKALQLLLQLCVLTLKQIYLRMKAADADNVADVHKYIPSALKG